MAIASAISSLFLAASQNPWHSLGVAVVLTPILYVILNEFIRASVRVKGIGGPCGLPLIGNLYQIRKNAAEQYRIWSKEYGPVFQIQLGNVPVLVINSAAAAKVLFGQNAQALSSRPEFYTFHKVRMRPDFPVHFVLIGMGLTMLDRFEHIRYDYWNITLQ